jgi:peptidoglycan-associated lipoprotein
MKRLSVCLIGLLVLAGCAGTNVKEATPAAPTTNETSQPSANTVAAVDPLADTNGVLARRSIYFAFDQSNIIDTNKTVLEAHAQYLKEHADSKIVLQGNTDERGSSEYNLALGNRRAENTKKVLAVLGVASKNIGVVSFGKEKPTSLCHEESCWAENRRADIVYSNVN